MEIDEMTTTPEMSDPIQAPGAPVPPPGAPAAEKTTTNGLAIAGFILAFLAAPLGFILSLIGFFQAGSRRQKGRGLAVGGIIVSLLVMAAGTAITVVLASKVATLADPGCTTGKAAILDNQQKAADPATMKEGIQATIDGLRAGAAKARHDNVRNAMQTLADDYSQLLKGLDTGNADPGLPSKITQDATEIDKLCTVGAK
jgi:hypothetical protein